MNGKCYNLTLLHMKKYLTKDTMTVCTSQLNCTSVRGTDGQTDCPIWLRVPRMHLMHYDTWCVYDKDHTSALWIKNTSKSDPCSYEVTSLINKAQKKFWGSNEIQTHELSYMYELSPIGSRANALHPSIIDKNNYYTTWAGQRNWPRYMHLHCTPLTHLCELTTNLYKLTSEHPLVPVSARQQLWWVHQLLVHHHYGYLQVLFCVLLNLEEQRI